MIYVVIDTNVLVSALLSKLPDSSTVVIRKYVLDGTIIPLYNDEIYTEYADVLHRPKLQPPKDQTDAILDAVIERGFISCDRQYKTLLEESNSGYSNGTVRNY